ncbi:MAG: hypothetical protein H5T62_13695 [Anaerolineae bacterium]|nr:hypothetical protein [Anaerolineae bacterium]
MRESLLAGLTDLYSQGRLSASVSIGENPSVGATLQDALKDLGARLLDARFRQHPEFTADVTPQALESLYKALIKGDGRIAPEMGQPHNYAAHYGLPLRIVRPAGTAYALDLGNSPYVQTIEEALKGGDGVRVRDLQERLGRDFGLPPFLTDFLARLTVIFRDLRVVRGREPLPIENPGQLSLHGNDLLMLGQRVSHGEWAAFTTFYTAIGAGTLPDQPSVHRQDAAWASLRQFVNRQGSTYAQLRQAVTEAATPLGGAPRELEQALQQIKAVLDQVEEALDEPTSEAGIRWLTRTTSPSQSLSQMLQEAREMSGRLQDVEVRGLYQQLHKSPSQVTAREAIAQYVTGQMQRKELVAQLQTLRQEEKEPLVVPGIGSLRLKVRFGALRKALEDGGLQPAEGWGALSELPDDAEVTVEVRQDAEV